MKTQQLISILLCALVSSTLAHDYLRAKQFSQEARASKLISPLQTRAAAPQQCEYVCNYTGIDQNLELQLVANSSTELVGVWNTTAKVGFIFDVNFNLAALFNGSSGAVIILNIKTQSGVYIAHGESTAGWLAAKISFQAYLNSLTSLQVLINLNVGTKFTVSSVSTDIGTIVARLLVALSARVESRLAIDVKLSLTLLLKLGTRLSVVLKGSLKGILQFYKGVGIALYGDLLWLVVVFEGIGEFLGNITGGLTALINAQVKLDLTLLLGATSGLQVLVNLVLAIVARLGTSVVVNLLNNQQLVLGLIVKLGGGLSVGVTGIFKIVYLIVGLVNNNIQLDVLLTALLEFAASRNGGGAIDVSIHIAALVSLVEVIKSLDSNASVSLKVFFAFVDGLKNGTLIISGIHVSAIIKLLAAAVPNPLQLVVSVLLLLTAVVSLAVSIPSLLLKLLVSLTTSAGVYLLIALGINIKVSNSSNIIASILQQVNLSTILRLILSGFNLDKVLRAIPIVSDIYVSLTTAIQVSSSGSITITQYISGSSSIIVDIQVFIKSILKIGGASAVTTTTESIDASGGVGVGIGVGVSLG